MHGSDFSTPDTPALKALERGATNNKILNIVDNKLKLTLVQNSSTLQ